MINDHNQTSHTYDKGFALEMIENIEKYVKLMEKVFNKLKF